jgi:hypothetical protein
MRITDQQDQPNSTAAQARAAANKISARGTATPAETSDSRALIPLTPVQSAKSTAAVVRQPVGFLAHLIATEQELPQTRERRRAEPMTAIAAYGSTSRRNNAIVSARLVSRAA